VVAENILQKIADENLSVHVVWTPVLASDEFESTSTAKNLIQDPRAMHYWDGDQNLGLAYGKVVRLPRGRDLAWDIYFAFGPDVVWEDEVPQPSAWAHQLGLDERRLDDGTRLREALEGLLNLEGPALTRSPGLADVHAGQ
jgi:hypothetical protein